MLRDGSILPPLCIWLMARELADFPCAVPSLGDPPCILNAEQNPRVSVEL